jgi:hypothetical protein
MIGWTLTLRQRDPAWIAACPHRSQHACAKSTAFAGGSEAESDEDLVPDRFPGDGAVADAEEDDDDAEDAATDLCFTGGTMPLKSTALGLPLRFTAPNMPEGKTPPRVSRASLAIAAAVRDFAVALALGYAESLPCHSLARTSGSEARAEASIDEARWLALTEAVSVPERPTRPSAAVTLRPSTAHPSPTVATPGDAYSGRRSAGGSRPGVSGALLPVH